MLSNKIYKKYGDIWGELFRMNPRNAIKHRAFDIYGKRPKHNSLYYRFSFYVGRFGVIRRRKTRYGKAFADKQKLKIFYSNIRESYIRFKWVKSLKYADQAMFKFFHYLESRLDVLLFRANYVYNMRQAQMLIEGGGVSINGKTMWDKAFMVSRFDIIRIKPHENILKFFKRLMQRGYKMFPIPSYLVVDYKTSSILYLGVNSIPPFPFKLDAHRFRILYH